MSNRRSHSRVTSPIEVSIHCDNGSVYRGEVKDFSISGINVKITNVFDLGPCAHGLLKMKLGSNENPYVAEFYGDVVRTEQNMIVYQLLGSDLSNFQHLKKTILAQASSPERMIKEIQRNPEVSLNSMYMPAMREALSAFIRNAVKSVFKIYLKTEVTLEEKAKTESPVDITVSGISSFNGSLHGSVILLADFNFAKIIVANLLELGQKSIDMPLIIDGFGEMTNMIAGGVQTGLSEEYENISLIPPTVFIGGQCMYGSEKLYSVKNHFCCQLGSFSIDCLFSVV